MPQIFTPPAEPPKNPFDRPPTRTEGAPGVANDSKIPIVGDAGEKEREAEREKAKTVEEEREAKGNPPAETKDTTPASPPPSAEPPPGNTQPGEGDTTETNTGDTDTGENSDDKGKNDKPPQEQTDAQKAVLAAIKDPNSGDKATFRDSMNKVLGIDEKTGKLSKGVKHVLHLLTAFGHGFVGRDDPLMQAAVSDFRAKRDAENTASAKKNEQIQLAQNMMASYQGITEGEALQFVVDLGNAKSAENEAAIQERMLEISNRHAEIMQDKAFQHQTAMLDQATRNELAKMVRAAGLNAEQAGLAMEAMARRANAFDEITGAIDPEKFGNFIRKTGGDTNQARGWDTLQGALNTFAAGASGMVFR
jgi:hypothetical protein